MILTKKIEVVVSGNGGKYYQQKGYKLPYSKDSRGRIGIKKGSKITIDIIDINPNSNIKIQYKCDSCGSIKESNAASIFSRKNSQYLKDKRIFCVKCAASKNNSNYKHGNSKYSEYIYSAKIRGIDFNLTVGEFENITNKPCHYCDGYSIDRNPRSKGNGIDRKDSHVGYIIENCVPSCATCNFIKNKMPYDDFITYIKQLYHTIKNYEI